MKVKILPDTRETTKLSPEGRLERWSIYSFMLDDKGPFYYEVKSAEDTPEHLKEAIRKKAETLKGVPAEI
jgi:hypothetical protein